tara:strand:+ start:117 stop:290 length:174 start_codon:yes stop_codon:yes gene_type:complete
LGIRITINKLSIKIQSFTQLFNASALDLLIAFVKLARKDLIDSSWQENIPSNIKSRI